MIQLKLKQVGAALRSLLTWQPPTTVGLDIGAGTIKFAEVRWEQGIPELMAAGIEKLPPNSVRNACILNKEKLVETLQRAWALHGITGKHVVVALSGQTVLIRELVFPAMSDDELRQAIKWELDKYIPAVDVANYYYDFAVLGPVSDIQGLRVLLVAAPLEMINGITEAVGEAGLKLLAIDIEPLALQRTMEKADNAIVIDIGVECCKLNLFQQGFPLVSRFIPFGGARNTEALLQEAIEPELSQREQWQEQQAVLVTGRCSDEEPVPVFHQNVELLAGILAREVRRTIDYYQMQNRNAYIDRIIVTGSGAQLDMATIYLSKILAGTKVVIHSPITSLQISPSLNKVSFQKNELQMAVAIGLALRGSDENNGG